MSKADTLTDVANLALSSIGEKRIQNIDDDSSIARDIRNVLYESIRQTQLEIFWQDLIVSFSPSALTEMYPFNDSLYQYNLPTNFLDVIELKSGADWFLEGGKFITSDPEPTIKYKRYSEEVTEWSGYLVELVYRRVASNVAMQLTQNQNVANTAIAMYDKCKMDALTRSSNRARNNRQRKKTYGNLRARLTNSSQWPWFGRP